VSGSKTTASAKPASASVGGSRLQAYLQLFRLPNIFTAIADVMMGFLFTHPALEPVGLFFLLVAASCLLYTAGMVLNDVFDVEVDRQERPGRPIPSGRISPFAARWLGFELLIVGAALGWLASFFAGDLRAGIVASGLALCVLAYDAGLKRTPLGPVAMGGCRFLNVLLGMSLAVDPLLGTPRPWQEAHLLVAAGIGVYIVGVTWFARREAATSGRWQLALATLVLLAGIALLAWLPNWDRRIIVPISRWHVFWGLIAVLIAWRCGRAVITPSPGNVQAAVKHCILSLILLDAVVVFAVRGGFWAVMVMLLTVPAMLIGRWIYST
jgi:4-hydroxybenzoate polyprenyltransferase